MASRLASCVLRASAVLGLVLLAPACGPLLEELPDPHAQVSSRAYPAWEGGDRDLFDDGVDPIAVGLSHEASPVPPDGSLQARTQVADAVAKVRVTTVTAEQTGEVSVYRLGIEVIRAYTDAASIRSAFELTLGQDATAYPVAKALESKLRGKQFIGVFRRFAPASSGSGEPALHWHLAADLPEVEATVKEALALKELQIR